MNFQIETTSHCNLACYECPHRFIKRKKEYMYEEVFDKILEDYLPSLNPRTMILHKDGEPLLHPDLGKYVGKISEVSTAKIDIYTNGLLLRPNFVEYLTSFVNSVWLLVSFHFYSYDGKLIDYSKVSATLEKCLDIADDSNVEFVFATHLVDISDQSFLRSWKTKWEMIQEKHPSLKAVHLNKVINPWAGRIESEHCATFPACPYQDGQHLFFGVTGNVIPCCIDLEEDIVFGNVMRDDPMEILSRRAEFYHRLRSGKVEEELCQKCIGK